MEEVNISMKVFLHPPSLCPHHTRYVSPVSQIEMQKELDSELGRGCTESQNHHRSSHYDVARYYDSPLPDPLEHSAAAAHSAMRAAAASHGTRGIPHGFPLCTMDHNHPESSQLKLGGRSPFGLQHRINMLFRG